MSEPDLPGPPPEATLDQAVAQTLAHADALAAAGQRDTAERVCRELLAGLPTERAAAHRACAGAWNRLAIWAAERGNGLRARACLEKAISIDPGDATLRANLCELLRRAELPEAALPHGERAVALKAEDPAANLNLACTLIDLKRPAEALPRLQWLASSDGGNPKVWFSLGRACQDLGRTADARAALLRCHGMAPHDPQVLQALSRVELELGLLDDAVAHAHLGLALMPDDVELVGVVAEALTRSSRLAEAEAVLRDVLARRPHQATLRFRLALNRLEQGDYREGFALYESRLDVVTATPIAHPVLPMPPWTGQDLRGRRLLVETEQGFGDHLMFARFVRDLAALGAEVHVTGAPPVLDLMTRLDGCTRALTYRADAVTSGCDFWVFIGSLAQRLAVTADTLQHHAAPYLHADAAKRAAWRSRLGPTPGRRRIGLVWSGRAENPYEARRSVSPAQFGPLAAVPQVQWIGLRMGAVAADSPLPMDILGPADLGSFDDTAALIAELDLLISVDTAFAHLAGAIGAPVWLLIPKAADWRWALAEGTTPWYPSMRVFRQRTAGDWDEVLQRVAATLTATAPR